MQSNLHPMSHIAPGLPRPPSLSPLPPLYVNSKLQGLIQTLPLTPRLRMLQHISVKVEMVVSRTGYRAIIVVDSIWWRLVVGPERIAARG